MKEPRRQHWRSTFSIEQVRAARMLADLSQAEAAELCGVPYPTWKGIERRRGRCRMQVGTMRKIRSAFYRAGVGFTEDGVRYLEGVENGKRWQARGGGAPGLTGKNP